ncbi:hypothetical protein Q3G72_031524 [Acer saccharum]|nr:hypothetical protein Q3G72_031524 [Acer saccharum]
MAEIVLSPLLEVVFDKLADPLLEEIANRFNLRKELKKLRRTLRVIRAVLEEAEERQLTDGALKIWLQELKEVAYEMEDLFDEFSPEALMSRNRGGFAQQVLNLVPFANLSEMFSKFKQIKETLEILAEESLRTIPEALYEAKKLRTLVLVFPKGDLGEVPPAVFSSFRYLRALDLSGSGIKKLHESISSFIVLRNSANSDIHGEVLICLRPHKYLKKLSINGYQGTRFPQWIGAAKIPNITELTLINCRRCEYLPTLGELPFLKLLYLQGMDAVKNIGPEFYGEGTTGGFPLLKELTFIDFPHLEYWWNSYSSDEFPSLIKLTITKCSRLKNMPRFPCLQHLQLYYCSGMILQSALNLTSITTLVLDGFSDQLGSLEKLLHNNALLISLTISSCLKLHSIPPTLGKLTSLKSLTIRWIKELSALPQELQNLTSLESLEIIECDNLTTLPEDIQSLGSLRTLSIENCNNLTSLPKNLQFLMALEHLTIMYCPKLVSLPEDLQHLTALKSLSILNCPELASLPEGLQYVTTLQNLELHSCPGLKVLPEWVANLNSLRSLALSECHNLTILPGGLQSVQGSLQAARLIETCNSFVALRYQTTYNCHRIKPSKPKRRPPLSILGDGSADFHHWDYRFYFK